MMLDNKKTLEKTLEEIELLLQFAVPREQYATAREFVERFKDDQFALNVIKDYYTTLPEAREEALVQIQVVEEKEQVFLLLLSTAEHHYFYLTNDEGGIFLGEWQDGIVDKQVLKFFDYPDSKSFKQAKKDRHSCREYMPLERMNEDVCPSCGARSGMLHTLGCPVEVCPWCGGQLNHCNCRFEQLGVEELHDETKLEELEDKLEKKGRIPYAKEQRPTFMAEE